MSRGRLHDLSMLAGLIRDRELAKVEKIVAHMNRLQSDIDRLRAATIRRGESADLDAARLLGADVAWAAWVESQLRRNLSQLAALRVSHEAALADARKALGRSDVLTKLSDKAAD